ncbi:MAG: hypothetical protein FWD53_07405, partial [Phycisphaerales bacterium]|nr:hypothetical protein [Phycisphaerales bacterium]
MRKVLLYSLLLIVGLVASQFLSKHEAVVQPIRVLTMIALAFIMIRVGYEFEIDKSCPRQYAWDYVVAGLAASLPWVFCTLYFVFVMAPSELWSHGDLWRESLLVALFSSPTSAGILFSMLAAAGLGATWVFRKARILAIFDDLNTILLLIPLKLMIVGLRWQLGVLVIIIFALFWLAWRYLHTVRWPISWPWILFYSVTLTVISEAIYLASKLIDAKEPIHLEILLPAFVVGCVLARLVKGDVHGEEDIIETPRELRVSTLVSACFMVLVGLSMPSICGDQTPIEHVVEALPYEGASSEVLAVKSAFPGWGMMALHVLAITALSNLGKMFPAFCYRKEASLKERIALSVGMFPRGEVGA